MKNEMIVFDEEISYDLDEVCCLCRISVERVVELVDEGVVTPSKSDPSQWVFDHLNIRRVQVAVRLQQDLNVNLPGVALVLDLLDEIHELRQQSRSRL